MLRVLQNHLCTQFLINCTRRTIFFGSNKWKLCSRVIVFNIILLIWSFRKNMCCLKIVIPILSLMCFMLGKNKNNSFLHGFSLLFVVTCFHGWLVVNPHGSYGTGFSHLLELVFNNFAMNFDLSLSLDNHSIMNYLLYVQSLVNELTPIGKSMLSSEHLNLILDGLPNEYNFSISVINLI